MMHCQSLTDTMTLPIIGMIPKTVELRKTIFWAVQLLRPRANPLATGPPPRVEYGSRPDFF
jgi:hypothetical protein